MSGLGPWKTLHDVSIWQVGHPRAKLVLIAIATSANSDERSGYMSLRSIAAFAEVTIAQARNWIRKLEEAGWLSTEQRFSHGRQTSNIYTILGEGKKLTGTKEQEAARSRWVQPGDEGGVGEAMESRGEGKALDCRGEGKAMELRPEGYKEDQKEVPPTPKGKNGNGSTHPEIFSLGAVVQPSRPVPMAEVAAGIVEHLNTATGSKFRPVASTLDPICARLREPGVDVAGVVKMIDRQVAKWKGTEMEQYLRPSTLFRASKFNEYYAAKDLPLPTNGARPKAMVERDAGLLDGGIGGFED